MAARSHDCTLNPDAIEPADFPFRSRNVAGHQPERLVDDLGDLYPREPRFKNDPTLSADGLADLLPPVEPAEAPSALEPAAVPVEDLLGGVEELFDEPLDGSLELGENVLTGGDDPDASVGDLVASLAEAIRALELAMRDDDDPVD